MRIFSAASIFAKGLGVSVAEPDSPAPAARNPDTTGVAMVQEKAHKQKAHLSLL